MKITLRALKYRAWLWLLLCAIAAGVLLGFPSIHTNAARNKASKKNTLGNYDIRAMGGPALTDLLRTQRAAAPRVQTRLASLKGASAQLRTTMPDANVQFSPLTGAAEVVSAKTGTLTNYAAGRNGWDIVRDFLRTNADAYGIDQQEVDNLHYIAESDSPSGLRMVRFEQMANGIPVFQSETRAILDHNGRLVRTLGALASGASEAEPLTGLISPEQAFSVAMDSVELNLGDATLSAENRDKEGHKGVIKTNHAKIKDDPTSKLVYFPIAPGIMIPAYAQVTFTRTKHDWYTLVDAKTGVLLWRKNIRADASTQQARFSVYVQGDGSTPADSPSPLSPTTATGGSHTQPSAISRSTVSMLTVQNTTASPNGWIDDGGTTTTGNNTDTYLDTDADDAPDTGLLDNNGRPVGNTDTFGRNRDFLGTGYAYTPPPTGSNPDAGSSPTDTQHRRGIVTQLFYLTNWYHDQLYSLGFDEAAGNFQTNNFGRGGMGGDPVLAEAQDGSGTDNSNFSTPPDGDSGRMQMFIFDFPTPERDGSLDSEVVLHELTHGTSNRLIGDSNGLIWDEGGGMGEGWSDFYALSLLNNTNSDNPNGKYASGAYATYQLLGLTDNYLYGIRRFPYSTDNTVNPLTWADVDDVTANMSGGIAPSPLGFQLNGALEVHNVGEIWCNSLWEVRSRIIADPAGANGDVPTGNHTMLQLVTDALKMTPINPSFIDARDALIAADGATHAYANEVSIWSGFADRGLGYKAIAPLGHVGVEGGGAQVGIGESFSVPYLDATMVTVNDSASPGNNTSHIDPGETVTLNVTLLNPWHKASQGVASASAVLTSSTPGVTIVNGNATYGAIAAQGTASGNFTVKADSSVTCGQALDFTVTTTSTLGTTSTTFRLRVGTPSGTGAPITYTRTVPASGLAIPDDDFRGTTDTLTVMDDFEISHIAFKLDELDHTFTGDLTVMLKAPNGYGTDLIYLRGFFTGDGDGDNFINTVIDESSTNDLNLSGSANAPFTGDWLPAFNSPIWSLFGIPNLGPDPVGQLSRLNGTSTKGDWKVHVTDEAFLDTGTLKKWSIIVTPVAYTCSPVAACTPTISCPANITAVTPNLSAMCTTVTYTTPAAGGGCGATVTCTPPSGTCFPAGTTTVTCTASGGTSATPVSCSFTVTVFNVRIQDDSIPSMVFQANSTTGAYKLCNCAGQTFTGTATVKRVGNTITFSQQGPDRRLTVTYDGGAFKGNAAMQFPVGTAKCTITDRDTRNDTMFCP